MAQPGEAFDDFGEYQRRAIAVLDVGGMDHGVNEIALIADVDSLRAAQRSATLALIDGDTQTARTLLSNFADQTAVRMGNLPMATYPTAIRRAAALIEAGQLDEAKTDLEQTLSTVVVTETVFPYPVINAVVSLALRKNWQRKRASPTRFAPLWLSHWRHLACLFSARRF